MSIYLTTSATSLLAFSTRLARLKLNCITTCSNPFSGVFGRLQGNSHTHTGDSTALFPRFTHLAYLNIAKLALSGSVASLYQTILTLCAKMLGLADNASIFGTEKLFLGQTTRSMMGSAIHDLYARSNYHIIFSSSSSRKTSHYKITQENKRKSG